MLTKDDFDDFGFPKSCDKLQNDTMLTDLDIPMLLENDSVLLRDASADEIMLEATNNDLSALTPPRDIQSPTYPILLNNVKNVNSSGSSRQQTFSYLTTEHAPQMEIKLEDIKIENALTDYDQLLIDNELSDNLFPSSSSPLNFNDSISESSLSNSSNCLLDTPPISPETTNSNIDSSISINKHLNFNNNVEGPIVLNSNKYKLIKVNCDETNTNSYNNRTKNNILNYKNESIAKTEFKKIKVGIKPLNSKDTKQKPVSLNGTMKSTPPAVVNIQNVTLGNDLPIVQCYPKQDITENNNVKIISIPNNCNSAVVIKSVNGVKTSNVNGMREIDLKALKRQQRMIKNRESACMSRKRKKDYVTSLEGQVKQLSFENHKLKTENELLRKKLSESNSGLKQFLYCMPSNGHKNSAVLLAMLLMVSLNIGSISFFYKRDNILSQYSNIEQSNVKERHSRTLLWMPDSWTNNTEYEDEPKLSNFSSFDFLNNTHKFSLCSMLINQTESIRLASELHKWIGEPPFNLTNLNLSKYSGRKRKIAIRNAIRSLSEYTDNTKYFSLKKYKQRRYYKSGKKNEVQVYSFDPKYYEYAQFFESIDKRDDTFYVVSFSGDNMLLPALNHNKTSRPKMSLILPALTINDSKSAGNEYVTFMKIDCDVTNTNLVHVKGDTIPQHLRSTITNSTGCKSENNQKSKKSFKTTATKPGNVTTDNVTLSQNRENKMFKPYFIKDTKNSKEDVRNLIYP